MNGSTYENTNNQIVGTNQNKFCGTSIQDLQKQNRINTYENVRSLHNMGQVQYGTLQNMQHEQGHNAAQSIHQAQHVPYYNIPNPQLYDQYPKQPNMTELAQDISNNLPDETYFTGVSEIPETDIEMSPQKDGYLDKLPIGFKEPLIILVLYIILSQSFVKDSIGRYITQINEDITGKVSMTGVIIYGTILASLFYLTKIFILK